MQLICGIFAFQMFIVSRASFRWQLSLPSTLVIVYANYSRTTRGHLFTCRASPLTRASTVYILYIDQFSSVYYLATIRNTHNRTEKQCTVESGD